MKKLLLLFFALLTCASLAHALDYTVREITEDVVVTDYSTSLRNVFLLTIKQNAYNSSGTKYTSTANIYIFPEKHSIEGTFSVDDYTIGEDSYIKYGSNANRYFQSGSYLTIVDKKDGTYSISGYAKTYSTSAYNYTYTVNQSENYCIFHTKDGGKANLFESEPTPISLTIENADAFYKSDTEIPGCLTLDVCKGLNTLELSFAVSGETIPEGTYPVNSTKANGTVLASEGLLKGPESDKPSPSFYQELDDFFSLKGNYFFTGGSLSVSYSDDSSKMTISGTMTSYKGSVITVNATGDNPFKPYEPKTYALTVSKIVATVHPKDTYDNKDYVSLTVTAKNGEADCNGNIRVDSAVLEGSYNYERFHSTMTYFGKDASGWYNNFIYGQDKENTMTIEKTGNPNEYKLNSRISCGGEKDYVIYTIKDAVFTWVAPTPFDAEPDKVSTFNAEYACEAEISRDFKAGTTTIFVENSSFSPLALVFTGTDDILPCRYIVSDTKTAGTIVASEGRQGTGWDMVETGTWYGEGISAYDYNPYYITGGYIDVNYIGNNVEFVGQITSKKGSTINVHAVCPNTVCQHPLPSNMMRGSLLGTTAQYMFAYDVTTTADLKLRLDATLSTTTPVDGLKVSVKVKDNEVDMSYDPQTGKCTASSIIKIEKDEEFEITVIFKYSAGSTTSKTVRYTVE